MNEDIMIVCSKITEAEWACSYSSRKECAFIIKKHARNLLYYTLNLECLGCPNHDYVQILSNEIAVFRLLFIEWVNSFDKSNDYKDNWGQLFR